MRPRDRFGFGFVGLRLWQVSNDPLNGHYAEASARRAGAVRPTRELRGSAMRQLVRGRALAAATAGLALALAASRPTAAEPGQAIQT